MKVFIFFSSFLTLAQCGIISHDHHDHAASSDEHKATSYQDIQIEHFHAVPTYIKDKHHEHQEHNDHPISKGKTSAKIEVHHGTKHDLGYAITNIHSDLHDDQHHEQQFIIGGGGGGESSEHHHEHVPSAETHSYEQLHEQHDDHSLDPHHHQHQQQYEDDYSHYRGYEGGGEDVSGDGGHVAAAAADESDNTSEGLGYYQ